MNQNDYIIDRIAIKGLIIFEKVIFVIGLTVHYAFISNIHRIEYNEI